VLDQSATAVAEVAESAGCASGGCPTCGPWSRDRCPRHGCRPVHIGETPWSPAQRNEILEGCGRPALDHGHPFGHRCLLRVGRLRAAGGCRFDGHPWTQTCTVDVVEPGHPAVAHLGSTWRWHDEVYQFRGLRSDARVLLAARAGELPLADGSTDDDPASVPLSWCFAEGRAASFPLTRSLPPCWRRRTTSAISRAVWAG